VTDVANTLRISERTVYEYIYSGKIRAAKIASKWRIRPEWVDEFVEQSAKTVTA
jgi:excisionase family DNA binding protein